ncbi:MAG: UbiA prenyltransferase family protein, partial [candidate division WOR-3 bacterium]
METILRFIKRAESHSLGRASFLVGCWIFLRVFFEGIFESYHSVGFSGFSYRMLLSYFIHFPLFYFSLFLILVLIISLVLNESVRNVTKTASIGLVLILFVPLIDFFVGGGYTITYPLRSGPYFIHFPNPFVSLAELGVSPGQRVIAGSVSILIGIYAFLKTNKILRSTFTSLSCLVVIIVFGGFTTMLALNRPESVYIPGGILYTDTQKYCAIYALIFSILAFAYLFSLNRESATLFLKALRLERVLFYGGVVVFGFVVSLRQQGVALEKGIFDYLGIVVMFMSIAFGFLSLQVFNDFFDTEIDRETGKRNLALMGIARKYQYVLFAYLLTLGLCCAVIINFQAFLILSAYLLLGVVYSMPPVRLKEIPLVSTFVIAVAVCLCIGLGFSVTYGGRAFTAIPGKLLIPTLVGITLGFVAKDIAHVEGDRINGVVTLPVLLYDPTRLLGRVPIALFVSCSYLPYAIFIPQSIPGAIFCAACTFVYTVAVRKTREIFYFLMLYAFSGYLLTVLVRVLPF